MDKLFIPVGETYKRLHISRAQLQRLFVFLPHMYIKQRETRLFVATYIEAYAETLEGAKATTPTARAVAAMPVAQALVAKAVATFDRELGRHATFKPAEVAQLFCVDRTTLTGWQNAGVLKPQRQSSGRGPVKYAREDLQQIYEWRLPKRR